MKLSILVMFLACATATVAAESPSNGMPVYQPRYAFKPLVEDYYPVASRKLKEQGTTKINLCYDDRGRPIQLAVEESSSFARLDEAAVRWGKAVRVTPGLIFGYPQQDCVAIPVKFSLEKSPKPPDQAEDRLVPAPPPRAIVVPPPILVPVPLPPPPPPVRLIPLGGESA